MPNEFDFSAAIVKLAEMEWECSAGAHHDAATINGNRVFIERKDCPTCTGTGRIVPFASLRVVCPSCFGHCKIGGAAEPSGPFTIPAVLVYRPCVRCEAQGWISEPDPRVACWEIMEHHPEIIKRLMEQPELYDEYEIKEALIRAALQQVKEQHEL